MPKNIPSDVPYAEVINRQGATATILCPLCAGHHLHPVREHLKRGHLTWRVAACDLYAPVNRDIRARGYVFQEAAA